MSNDTEERIDWISFTLPFNTNPVWPNGLETTATTTKSFNGYDTALEYPDGRIELTSSHRPEMGIHCVLAGKTCSNVRDYLPKILELCWLQGGKVTRFDVCIDDLRGRINPRDSVAYLKAGKVKCRAREYPIGGDVLQGGYSQYFGRMVSDVHVCLYEKDAEQKIYGFRVRCEIRFKSKRSDKAAREYLSSNDCRGLILGFVDIPQWPEWHEVFATKPIQVLAEKTSSRRVAWLLGQVAKSMALEVSERMGDMEILELFHESVMAHLSDLRQSGDEK